MGIDIAMQQPTTATHKRQTNRWAGTTSDLI